MGLSKLIFALLLLLALVVGGILIAPGAEIAAHVPHGRVSAMFSGGDGAARHASTLALGWAFGTIQLLIFAALMALGVRKNGSMRGFTTTLVGCTGFLIILWTAIVVTYRDYAAGSDSVLVLGMHASTALVVLGFWPLSTILTVAFVVGFNRWVYTPEDEEAFERLVAERGRSDGQAEGRG